MRFLWGLGEPVPDSVQHSARISGLNHCGDWEPSLSPSYTAHSCVLQLCTLDRPFPVLGMGALGLTVLSGPSFILSACLVCLTFLSPATEILSVPTVPGPAKAPFPYSSSSRTLTPAQDPAVSSPTALLPPGIGSGQHQSMES